MNYTTEVKEGILFINLNGDLLGEQSGLELIELINNKIKDQELNKGDVIMFASVGAGMNVNAIVYRY